MIDTDKLPLGILQAIAGNMGWDESEDIEPYKAKIATLDISEAFDKFCNWSGLVGYGPTLRHTMKKLEEASK